MKRKPKDMSEFHARRAGAARASEKISRALEGKEFKSRAELEQFMQSLSGRSFDDIELPPPTPKQQAQDMVYDAWEEPSAKRRIEIAENAIKLWSDCADAYCVLAEEAASAAEERRLLEAAVAAGERAIGPDMLKEDVGRFWGIHSTRPYMRARMLLADFLWFEGEKEAAIGHARELLRLNPNDNQGVRYSFVGWLLATGNNRGAIGLLMRYNDDHSAGLEYARALLEFRVSGDSVPAREALRRAFESNRFLPEYLIQLRDNPDALPDCFAHDSDDEAQIVLSDLGEAWHETPGAIDWLRDRWRAEAAD